MSTEQNPANELQLAWDQQWEALYAARTPLPRLTHNLIIQNVDDVAFAVGEQLRYRHAVAALKAQFAAKIAQAERYVESVEQARRPVIEELVRREVAGQKTKSLKLNTAAGPEPTRVGFRKKPGGLKIVDEKAAVAWAEGGPDGLLVERVVVKPVADAFKAYFAASGEIPDGCIVQEDSETFYVQDKEDKGNE